MKWSKSTICCKVSVTCVSDCDYKMAEQCLFFWLYFDCETALVAYFSTTQWPWWLVLDRMRRVASEKTACCCMHIAKSKGLGTPLVSVAGWRVSSSGTQTDSDGGVVTLVTVGDGPTCPGQSCSVRPPERSRAQPRQQHRTLVVPHLCLVKPISMYQMRPYKDIRTEEPHLALVDVIFLGDFSYLS